MVYIHLGDRLYRVRDGIARQQIIQQGVINALHRRSKMVYAIPVKRSHYIEGLNIPIERNEYIYFYLQDNGQRVMITEMDMRRLFHTGALPREHRALVGKDILIVEDNK